MAGRSEQAPSGHPGLKRRHWRWALYVGCWTFIGLFFISPIIAQALATQAAIPWRQVLSTFLDWYLWGLLFPLIWWVSRRFPFERRKFISRIPIRQI